MKHLTENLHQNNHLFWVLAQSIFLCEEKKEKCVDIYWNNSKEYSNKHVPRYNQFNIKTLTLAALRLNLRFPFSASGRFRLFLLWGLKRDFIKTIFYKTIASQKIQHIFYMSTLNWIKDSLMHKHLPNKQENCLFSHLTPIKWENKVRNNEEERIFW